MKQGSKWIRWISFIFAVGVMYVAFQLFAFISSEKTSQLQNHLPAGASVVLKVNNPNIFKRFAYDFLFVSGIAPEDFESWEAPTSREELPAYGIDATQELFVFKEDWNNTSLFGAIVHLNNPKNFTNFLEESKEIVGAIGTRNIGVILLLPKGINKQQTDRFQQYASDLTVPTRDRFKSRIALSNSPRNTLLHLFYDGGRESFIQNLDLTMTMAESEMLFNGTATRNPIFESPSFTIPMMQRERGAEEMEFRMISFPDTLKEVIDEFYEELGVHIREPQYHQIFYRGMTIVDNNNQSKYLPNMDLLVHADSIYFSCVDTLLVGQEKIIRLHNQTYHVYFHSENTVYIGKQKKPEIRDTQLSEIIYVKGNPAALMQLDGSSFFVQIIQFLPPFRHTKNWLTEMKRFEFSGSLLGQDRVLVEGVVGFDQEKTASYELLQFLLNF